MASFIGPLPKHKPGSLSHIVADRVHGFLQYADENKRLRARHREAEETIQHLLMDIQDQKTMLKWQTRIHKTNLVNDHHDLMRARKKHDKTMLRVHALLQDKYKGHIPRRLCRYGQRCRRHRRGKCPFGHDGVSGLVNLWRHIPIDEDKARTWLTKPCANPICGHMGLKRFHSICITKEGAPCVPFLVCECPECHTLRKMYFHH